MGSGTPQTQKAKKMTNIHIITASILTIFLGTGCGGGDTNVTSPTSETGGAWNMLSETGGAASTPSETGGAASTPSGTGGSSSTSSGTGGSSSTNACTSAATTTCGRCNATNCCDEVTACANRSGCVTLFTCISDCPSNSSTCVTNCANRATTADAQLLVNYLDCSTSNCTSACG